MKKLKEICKKISAVISTVFGYGIMVVLFAGGLTFFGYLAALIIGGDVAAAICTVIYKQIIPVIIKCSTVLVLLGLLAMYLRGEVALTPGKKTARHKAEL